MRTIYSFGLVIGVALILMAALAFQAFKPSPVAQDNSLRYTGMGDLRQFEAQQNPVPVTGSLNSTHPVGMGDLRQFEAQR